MNHADHTVIKTMELYKSRGCTNPNLLCEGRGEQIGVEVDILRPTEYLGIKKVWCKKCGFTILNKDGFDGKKFVKGFSDQHPDEPD